MSKMNNSPINSLNGSGPKARPKRFFPDEAADAISPDSDSTTPIIKLPPDKKKTASVALVPWAAKINPELKTRLNEMMKTAPRHVLMQDLVEFILTDFFERNPTLPSALVDRLKQGS
jgi:hypothetical protein